MVQVQGIDRTDEGAQLAFSEANAHRVKGDLPSAVEKYEEAQRVKKFMAY